jgi:hypothetical protein
MDDKGTVQAPERLPGEGLVVTVDGQRVDGHVYTTTEAAEQAAGKKKQSLTEQTGSAAKTVAVKTQLFG